MSELLSSANEVGRGQNRRVKVERATDDVKARGGALRYFGRINLTIEGRRFHNYLKKRYDVKPRLTSMGEHSTRHGDARDNEAFKSGYQCE